MMNLEDVPDINAAFDPETLEYNPLSHSARWWCENFFLPILEEEHTPTAFTEAVRLIALHQVAPPPWLAAAMLKQIKVKPPRTNALSVQKAHEAKLDIATIQAERSLSIRAIAELHLLGQQMNKSKLDRLLKIYRQHEERLNKVMDKLP